MLNENQNCDRKKNVNEKTKKIFGKKFAQKEFFFSLQPRYRTVVFVFRLI